MGNGNRAGGARARTSRRRFLRGAGLLAAAGAVTAVHADHAGADNNDPLVLGSKVNTATLPTGLSITSGTETEYGFAVTDNGPSSLPTIAPTVLVHAQGESFANALQVIAQGEAGGIDVEAEDAIALYAAVSSNQSYARAVSASAYGARTVEIQANADATSSSREALYVAQNGTADAVYVVTSPTTHGAAVHVLNPGLGVGVNVTNTNTGSTAVALSGTATKGAGVKGTGKVGGQFSGTAAHLRLTPTSKTAPPSGGSPGDFFVDKNGHLYFHNANAWVQLA